jgi:type I restriction enzyme S subunit
MAGEWRDATVGDIAASSRNALVGGPFGSNLVSRDYVSEGVPVIRGQNMGTRWVSGEFAFVSEEKAQSLEANLAGPGDIVFTQRGTLGQVCLVPDAPFDRYLLSQSQMKLTVDRNVADPRFFYYVFTSAEQQHYIRQHAIQTGVPHTNLGILRATPLQVPPLAEQRAIAHILGTLDDKIELNRRMSESLEAIARALFKSWFVDFDPVRAKAEGRSPGLPQPLADLFPARLVDSDLGEIPEGWDVGPLKSVVVLQRGFDLPAQKRTSGLYPVLAASGPSGTHSEFMVRGPGVTTGRSGVLGRVFYVHDDFWPLNTSLWVKEFRHSTPTYAFHLLGTLNFESFNAGSAVPTLNRNHVHSLPTLLPPMEIIAAFERLAVAGLRSQKHGDDQSRTLAALRDTLLPKLISGELKVEPVPLRGSRDAVGKEGLCG